VRRKMEGDLVQGRSTCACDASICSGSETLSTPCSGERCEDDCARARVGKKVCLRQLQEWHGLATAWDVLILHGMTRLQPWAAGLADERRSSSRCRHAQVLPCPPPFSTAMAMNDDEIFVHLDRLVLHHGCTSEG